MSRFLFDVLPIYINLFLFLFFFFFKQKTAYEIYQCDWSSDVCSSDLITDSDSRKKTNGQVACHMQLQGLATESPKAPEISHRKRLALFLKD